MMRGRASKQLFFGEISTGASNDIARGTEIARKMISDYGMSDKFENVVLSSQRSPAFLPGEIASGQREYSESTQQFIDEEITRIVKSRYEKAIGEEEFKALLNTL
jgi:cell division protease FtsH